MFKEIREILKKKELLQYLVRSELRVTYRNKALGFLWVVLDPLFLMLVYLFLIELVFNRGGQYFPIMLFICLLSFRWISTSMSTGVKSLVSNGKLIQTIKFPKSILPLVRTRIGFVNFSIGLLVVFAMIAFYQITPTIKMLFLPVIVLVQYLFVAGITSLVALGGLFFRDLQNILLFGMRIWFYASPGLYHLEDIPEKYQSILCILNPVAPLFTSYKNVLVRGEMPNEYLIWTFVVSIILLIVSFNLFHKKNNQFVKYL